MKGAAYNKHTEWINSGDIPTEASPMIYDVGARSVFHNNSMVKLSSVENDVFLMIASAGGKLITHAALAWVMKDGEVVTVKTIHVNICRIRAKMRKKGWPNPIDGRWGYGYWLRFPVQLDKMNMPPVVIPGHLRMTLLHILYSHKNKKAADLILAEVEMKT